MFNNLMYLNFSSYIIYFILPFLFSVIIQQKLRYKYKKYLQESNMTNQSGSEIARRILDINGLYDVKIELGGAALSDHYDTVHKTLRLSEEVYYGKSVAAMAISAHEVGHAIQDKEKYSFLSLRTALVPIVSLCSNLSFYIIFLGLFFRRSMFINIGILVYIVIFLFTLVTLPVEYDASKRAYEQLKRGIAYDESLYKVKDMLNAAALTYVASTAAALAQLLRLLSYRRND